MRQRRRVALISWNASLANEHRRLLEAAGFLVEPQISRASGMIGKLATAAPSAVVIDLDNKPSSGREVAIMLRTSKAARNFPLIFAGGTEEKISHVRAEIPDAVYCTWSTIKAGIERGIRHAPVSPARPRGRGAKAVSGPVLAKKMGVRPGMHLTILGDVIGLGRRLAVEWEEHLHIRTEIAVAVVRTGREVEDVFAMLAAQLPAKAAVWIIHPKQSGRLKPDFTQKDILAVGQAFGFSGFLMCAVDADWSGARLVRKSLR